jgi:hypothetical protein
MNNQHVWDPYYKYLDALRASGRTNMFGAAPFLAEEHYLDLQEAKQIVLAWMAQFKEEQSK